MSVESGFVHYWVKQKHYYEKKFPNRWKELLKFIEMAYFDGYDNKYVVEPILKYRIEVKENNYNDDDRHYIEMYMHFAFNAGKQQRKEDDNTLSYLK